MANMQDEMTVTLKLDADALKEVYAQLAHLTRRVSALETVAAHHVEEDAAIDADAIRIERDRPEAPICPRCWGSVGPFEPSLFSGGRKYHLRCYYPIPLGGWTP